MLRAPQVSAPTQNAGVEPDVLPEGDGDDDGDLAPGDTAEPDLDTFPTDQATGFEVGAPDDLREPPPGSEEDAAPVDESGGSHTAEPTGQAQAAVIDDEDADPPDGAESAAADYVETLRAPEEDTLPGDPMAGTLGAFGGAAPVEQLDGDEPASEDPESAETESDDITLETDLDSTEDPGPDESQSPAPTTGQEDPGDDPAEQPEQETTSGSTEGVAAEDAEGPEETPVPSSSEEEDLLQEPAYRLIDELEPRAPSSRVVEVSGSVAALLKELDEKLEALPSGIELIDMPVLERRRIADRREELLSDRQLLLEQKRRGAHRRRRSRVKRQST
jgi:hypothetical protein